MKQIGWFNIIAGIFFVWFEIFVIKSHSNFGLAMRGLVILLWLWNIYRGIKMISAPPPRYHDWQLIEWASGTEVYKCRGCGIIKKERQSLWDRMNE